MPIPRPILNTCCFCISTRIGTIIIGVLDLISAVIGIITSILFLASPETTNGEYRYKQMRLQVEAEGLTNYMVIFLIIVLVVCIFRVVTASLLIYGVKNMRPGLMLPFIFVLAISLIRSVGMDTVFMVRGKDLIQGLVAVIVGNLLGIYFLLVVYSHYQELRDRGIRIADAPRDAPRDAPSDAPEDAPSIEQKY